MSSANDPVVRSNDADLVRYIEKDVELKILEDNLRNNYDLLRRRKILLAREREELDDVNFSVWAAEDEYCNEIWKLSLENNFDALFNRSPDALDPCLELDRVNKESYVAEVEEGANETVKSLEIEIDAIVKGMSLMRERDIQQEIKDALEKLENLTLLSEEISEVIRLTKPQGKPFKNIGNTHLAKNTRSPYANRKKTKPCKDSLNDNDKRKNSPVLRNFHWKKSHGNNPTEFVRAKKLLEKPACHPRIIIGKKITTTRRTVIERINSEHSTGGKRISKFVVKKRSHISLQLQPKQTLSENNTCCYN